MAEAMVPMYNEKSGGDYFGRFQPVPDNFFSGYFFSGSTRSTKIIVSKVRLNDLL